MNNILFIEVRHFYFSFIQFLTNILFANKLFLDLTAYNQGSKSHWRCQGGWGGGGGGRRGGGGGSNGHSSPLPKFFFENIFLWSPKGNFLNFNKKNFI